jgi:hypothetical protein
MTHPIFSLFNRNRYDTGRAVHFLCFESSIFYLCSAQYGIFVAIYSELPTSPMLHNAPHPQRTSSFSVTSEPVACQTIFYKTGTVLRIKGISITSFGMEIWFFT